jgi:benzoylformate decarboxylase
LLPAQQPRADQLAEHDVVVVLGARIFLYYAHVPGHPIKPGTKLFQITNSPLDAAAALAGTSIVGNIAASADYIRAHSRARQRSAKTFVPPAGPNSEHPITPALLFATLNRVMPRNAIIAEECPSSKGALDRYLMLDEPCSFYSVPNGVLDLVCRRRSACKWRILNGESCVRSAMARSDTRSRRCGRLCNRKRR